MKFIVDNWLLITIALASGGLLLWPIIQGATVTGLTPAAAVTLINREKAVVVDVRDASEFSAGHLVGAKNIPLADLESKLGSGVKNKNLPLILVCQTGARSARALLTARKLGYLQSQSLAGGIAAWAGASLPLEKVES